MSFLFSQPRGVVKTPIYIGEISTSRKVVTFLLFIYSHRGPFPPPYMGSSVGVLCTGYRLPLTVLVTFLALACFKNSSDQYQKFNSLLRGIKSGLWAELNPRPTFHRGFASEELLFPVETQVFPKIWIYYAAHNNSKYYLIASYLLGKPTNNRIS